MFFKLNLFSFHLFMNCFLQLARYFFFKPDFITLGSLEELRSSISQLCVTETSSEIIWKLIDVTEQRCPAPEKLREFLSKKLQAAIPLARPLSSLEGLFLAPGELIVDPLETLKNTSLFTLVNYAFTLAPSDIQNANTGLFDALISNPLRAFSKLTPELGFECRS
jgi:hypothetical protein